VEAGSQVDLPEVVGESFEVFVNGIPQVEGRDFTRVGRSLVFDRKLQQEGRLGFWRWLSIVLGIAGTYRKNDSVDVVFTVNGRRTVASLAPREPAGASPA
jgi:hypothetical protein